MPCCDKDKDFYNVLGNILLKLRDVIIKVGVDVVEIYGLYTC